MKYVFLLTILVNNDWSIPVLSLKNITLMILEAQRQYMNRKYCSGALDLQDISENIKWHTKNILEAERQAPQVTECM